MAGTAQKVPAIAAGEVDVHWRTGESRILEYFRASTNLVWTKREALTQSWCSHFVMWVLKQAGIDPLPPAGVPPPANFSVGRFGKPWARFGVYDAFPVSGGKYVPKPGDLYYLPNFHDHIGIIEDVSPNDAGQPMITTINGNGFDQSKAGFAELVKGKNDKLVMAMGGGFISRSGPTDLRDGKASHMNSWYVALPGP